MTFLTDAWAVHWPANPDGEHIWLFSSELDAKGFARTVADHTTVSWEPVHSAATARRIITARRRDRMPTPPHIHA